MAAGGHSEVLGMEVLVGLQTHHFRWVVSKNPADSGTEEGKLVESPEDGWEEGREGGRV